MNETTLYYLFSTFAQAYAAIMGFLIAVVAYKMGKLRDERESCKDRALEHFALLTGPEAYLWDPETMEVKWSDEILGVKRLGWSQDNLFRNEIMETEVRRIGRSRLWSSDMRVVSNYFFGYHFPLIILSLVGICFAPVLELRHHMCWLIILLGSALVPSLYLTYIMGRCILDQPEDKKIQEKMETLRGCIYIWLNHPVAWKRVSRSLSDRSSS